MTLDKSLDLLSLSFPAVAWVPSSLPRPALLGWFCEAQMIQQMEEGSIPGRLDVDVREGQGPE